MTDTKRKTTHDTTSTMSSNKGMTRRTFIWSAAAGGVIAGAAVPFRKVYAGKKHRLRYVTFVNKNSVWGQPYHFMAEEVDKASGGELKIQYAGGSEVVGGFDAPEAVAKGVFDMSHSANSYFAGAMPSSISLASGNASLQKLRDSGVLALYDSILQERRGLKLLGVPMSGVGYVFMTRGEPKDLSYFKGKKIRSIPLYDPILQELGAVTVTTSPAEAYTALERGVVDGLGWPDIGLFDFKFHKQAKFVMAPSFYTLRTCTLMNPNSFNKLPKELQDVLVKASKSADDRGEAWCAERSAKERAKMTSEGLTVTELPSAQGGKFVSMTEDKLWTKVLDQSPDNGAKLKAAFSKVG